MPIGQTIIGGVGRSELQASQARLNDFNQRVGRGKRFEEFQQAEASGWENFYTGLGKGGLKMAESTLNFPFDMVGAEERKFTFSDYIPFI